MRMKKIISGVLIGLLIGVAGTTFATQYVVEDASFPILVNGQAFKTDKPIVTINGSTYMPLRAIGEALGVKVNWNDDKGQVEIGETVTSEYSYSNPAPIGTTQTHYDELLNDIAVTNVTLKEIIRGDKAWELIKKANSFNSAAEEGYEYIVANIEVKLANYTEGKSYSLTSYNFDLMSSEGKIYDRKMIVAPTPKLDADLYKGASNTGYIVFKVAKTDKEPKIVFGRKYDGTGGIWFKAYN